MYSFAVIFVGGRIAPSSDGPYRVPAEINSNQMSHYSNANKVKQ